MAALDDARNYITARFGPQYTAWLALGDDDASRTLVSAADYIDSYAWQGTATGQVLVNGVLTPTTRQWPRTGVLVNGVQLDPTLIPQQIVNAQFELAVMLLQDPTLSNSVDSGSNVSSLGAGPARLSFFRPTSVLDGNATVLPPLINRMIGQFLASASPTAQPTIFVSGINGRSDFRDEERCCHGCGFVPCRCFGGRMDLRWPV